MSTVAVIPFTDYQQTVTAALDIIGAEEVLVQSRLIVIKPNLTNADPPPVTTPVECVAAIADYCRKHSDAEVIIGEGCGSGRTIDAFAANGYVDLAEREGLRLVDFNTRDTVRVFNPQAGQIKEFEMPAILQQATVISVPVLKDHSFTGTTIAMKNMFGIAPAPFYQGSWNKSALHHPCTHQSVVDICGYKKPALNVVDAVTALTGMHLSGTPKDIGLILASRDPVAVDAVGSRLLGHDPHRIKYLVMADGVLGHLDGIIEKGV